MSNTCSSKPSSMPSESAPAPEQTSSVAPLQGTSTGPQPAEEESTFDIELLKRVGAGPLFSQSVLQQLVKDLQQARIGKIKTITIPDVNGEEHHVPIEKDARYEIVYNGSFAISYSHPWNVIYLCNDKKYRRCPFYIKKRWSGHTDLSDQMNGASWMNRRALVEQLQIEWIKSNARKSLTWFLDDNLPKARRVTKIMCLHTGPYINHLLESSIRRPFFLHQVAYLLYEHLRRQQGTDLEIQVFVQDRGYSDAIRSILQEEMPKIQIVEYPEALQQLDPHTFVIVGQDPCDADSATYRHAMPIAELAIDLAGQRGPAGMFTRKFGREDWDLVAEGRYDKPHLGRYNEIQGFRDWSPQWGTPRMCEWKDGCARGVLFNYSESTTKTMFFADGPIEVLLRKDV
ncbi:hypothetical protein K491DRAFT_714561 [Lophiostoma macrostomum CBS 122681]|uniref:SRR1-like domain-containing protein n=1 Tax=Lophiostoma macrostomum CBS 122681 TaxID=1314788 RepID=A0A6A6TBK2_9PLEO|nr:hypothetical protein K491DRAFT_714561 [Lophiostoma macrostomum CBS 122681]